MENQAPRTVLQLQGLDIRFATRAGELHAVSDLYLTAREDEIVGLVGESGSGKTVTGLAIMRLLPSPPAQVTGHILFEGADLLRLSEKDMSRMRGGKVAMIYQDPMSSLNPVLRIGDQIGEAVMKHQGVTKKEAIQIAIEAMRDVGIASPERRAREYPHQMSGGMRQRIVIATALSCSPKLLIADEPTTMLDLISQSQIINLLKKLRGRLRSIIYITHDMGIVAQLCDRVAVIYASRLMEVADVKTLFSRPLHPYTIGLLEAVPRADIKVKALRYIDGNIPDLVKPPTGCIFHPRCRWTTQECKDVIPKLCEIEPGHLAACHKAGEKLWNKT
jgi:oligopeptide transport system ATP-binding protein